MRHHIALANVAAVAIIASLPACAGDCNSLMNTMLAQTSTPYGATITMQGPNEPARTSKVISIGNMMYTQVDGAWRSIPMSGAEVADQMRSAAKTAKETCSTAGTDAVNGTPATLYTAHVENRGSVSDNKVWVSGNKILKVEASLQGGMHMVTVYDYTNISAPAGAKPLGAK
jgi:enamine deaminase RidA (YjgF/YER057c/UK114 family)